MLKRFLAVTGVAGLLIIVHSPAAQAQMAKPTGQDTTIAGTVIDISCKLTKGVSGEGHVKCAQMCADAGVTLGILTSDGKLYLPISETPAKGENARLKEFVEQQVTVTGKVFTHQGATGIQIAQISKKM